ncbi:MAG: sigma-54 dependent transcriptional regulator [Bacteroidota bacterium]|nr:sigma-54 dependent transcriptional regulator [Bacteroidota bacterium]
MEVQRIKQRFGIIGNSGILSRAIDIAVQVAPTDLSVLISGESGSGKEVFPKIIHQYGMRKHQNYIAVNCGAIPEGTIDSELFGHEKGSFTGATDSRKGYFEVADKGTIFLDEVGELPLPTQVRLLRVLETGEFMKVGSSKVIKTDVRVVAATNINITEAIATNKFREDLFYRLNTVPIAIPSLRVRKDDIFLLFRKFAMDFAERYRMPAIKLNEESQQLLINYKWPGNVRQLKNITEQISIIEQERNITAETLERYLPVSNMPNLPAIYKPIDEKTFASEREILYQVLFDMKRDMNDMKKLVNEIMQRGADNINVQEENENIIKRFYGEQKETSPEEIISPKESYKPHTEDASMIEDTEEYVEESLSLQDKEIEMIKKALEKHKGKRKYAAGDLGISERTLYRKIKEYEIDG